MRWEEKLFLILIPKYIKCKHFTFMRKFNTQLYEYESLLSAQMKIVISQTHHSCHIYQIRFFSVVLPSSSVPYSRKLAQGYKFSLLSDFVLSRYIFLIPFHFLFCRCIVFQKQLAGFFVGIFVVVLQAITMLQLQKVICFHSGRLLAQCQYRIS